MTVRVLTDLGWRNVMGADPKPAKRVKATTAEWDRLHGTKGRMPCRVCTRRDVKRSLHHLVSRSLGGDDVANNLVPLCGSGTTGCHGLIEAFDPWACSLLGARLSMAEREYVTAKKGAYYLETRYGVKEAA